MHKYPNVYIVDPDKWSFIETIGVSDVVVTQGVTSSATIAIICGVEGLYFDEAGEDHPLSAAFKNRIVFDSAAELLSMLQKIIDGSENPIKGIPEYILRAYDAYPDDRGIDLLRNILSGGADKRIGIIIQARMGSQRLPGKIMVPFLGRPALEVLIERLKRSRLADIIVIATSQDRQDDKVGHLACRLGVTCFKGSQSDVLGRYYLAAEQNNIDVIVRITADCPLADPEIVDSVIARHIQAKADYTTNSMQAGYPRGLDVEVFNFDGLKKINKDAQKDYQREHVTPYFYENPNIFKITQLSAPPELQWPDLRLTLDTQEDYNLLCKVFERLYHKDRNFTASDIVNLFQQEPSLKSINKNVTQKELYNAS